MNLMDKWKVRKRIISNIKNKKMDAGSLKEYIKYLTVYDNSSMVDECSASCLINNITGVHTLVIDGRSDINIDLSIIGSSIMLKLYLINGHSTVERDFGFRDVLSIECLVEKPITDCSNTINDSIDIICNSILYTIKNYTKSWWKNEKGIRDNS